MVYLLINGDTPRNRKLTNTITRGPQWRNDSTDQANYDHDGSVRPFFSKPKNNELYVMLLEKDPQGRPVAIFDAGRDPFGEDFYHPSAAICSKYTWHNILNTLGMVDDWIYSSDWVSHSCFRLFWWSFSRRPSPSSAGVTPPWRAEIPPGPSGPWRGIPRVEAQGRSCAT